MLTPSPSQWTILPHSLTGWALGQAGLKTKSRKGLAALVLGANMPDIDVFFGWVPWAPLATHRGFTHGVGGDPVDAAFAGRTAVAAGPMAPEARSGQNAAAGNCR